MKELKEYLKTVKKKQIIFDFDETIVTLKLPWPKFKDKIVSILNEVDPNFLNEYPQLKGTFNKLANQAILELGNDFYIPFIEAQADFEKNYLEGLILNDQLIEFIKKNHHKYEFFLWTNNTSRTVLPILKELGIHSFFKTKVTRDKVKMAKPYTEGFNLIFNSKENKKEDFLMCGDSNSDKIVSELSGIDYFKIKIES